MKAQELYAKLEKDFDLAHCRDDWAKMDFNEFISDNYKKRNMGLLADNTSEIKKVYTAVFPSEQVIKKILAKKEKNALLFIHHPMIWNLNGKEGVFRSIPGELLKKLKDNGIAVYNLHTPLDNADVDFYTTSSSLARVANIKVEKTFYEYFGHPAGVIGSTDCDTIDKFVEKVKEIVGHNVKLWRYGQNKINNHQVAIIAGGGLDLQAITEIDALGVNTFLSGVTRPTKGYKPVIDAHAFAKEKGINIIGATHYSTEKFACIAMVDYFKKLGLKAEFISDKPDFEDIDYGFKG